MDSWLKAIGESLRWGPMNIWIGFSFLMESHQEGERKIVYWQGFYFNILTQLFFSYAARELSFVHTKINSEEQFDKFREKFDDFIELDFLKATFLATQEENVFAKSGFVPYKTVAAYIWIRK